MEHSFTLAELATLTKSELKGDPNHVISNVADLESAGVKDASFVSNPRYTETRYIGAMKSSKAGVIFVAPSVPLVEGKNFLIHEDPSRAFQQTIEAIRGSSNVLTGFEGIHPTAVIHESCTLGQKLTIGPHAVIDAGTVIGDRTHIGAGTYIGPNCTIGDDCIIHPNVTLREQTQIGNRVILQPGVVLGGCGFGFTTDDQGHHTKITHIGNVIIEDDVEIGSNSTIDRARFTSSIVGRGTKIDNCVVMAHNVKIGPHNFIAGLVGIAGSTETGRNVVLAGQTGVNGHIKLGDGVVVSARSGVSKSIAKPGTYGGMPPVPQDEHNRKVVMLRNIDKLIKRVETLEKKALE